MSNRYLLTKSAYELADDAKNKAMFKGVLQGCLQAIIIISCIFLQTCTQHQEKSPKSNVPSTIKTEPTKSIKKHQTFSPIANVA